MSSKSSRISIDTATDLDWELLPGKENFLNYIGWPSPSPRRRNPAAGKSQGDREPSRSSKDANFVKPLIMPDRADAVSQVFFSMSMYTPRSPNCWGMVEPRNAQLELVKEDQIRGGGNFTKLLPPRTPISGGFAKPPLPPRTESADQAAMKENALVAMSLTTPRTPRDRRGFTNLNIETEPPELIMKENQLFRTSVLLIKSPRPLMKNRFISNGVSPPSSPILKGVIKLDQVETEPIAKIIVELQEYPVNPFPLGVDQEEVFQVDEEEQLSLKDSEFEEKDMKKLLLDLSDQVHSDHEQWLEEEEGRMSMTRRLSGIEALFSIGFAATTTLCVFAISMTKSSSSSSNISARKHKYSNFVIQL